MQRKDFDVVVVGASLAGCTAATLLARQGARVALLERHARTDAHKAMCTHYVQASALPVLQRLGLTRAIEQAGGVRNGIELHTPAGWIGWRPGLAADGQPWHGYNVRRAVLDPLVRRLAACTPGVTLLTGVAAQQVLTQRGQVVGVQAQQQGLPVQFMARLVVAADGRGSDVATQAGIPVRSAPNVRHSVAVALRGVGLRRGQLSQMWMTGPEVFYCFPNDDGVTVLAWMAPKEAMSRLPRDEALSALKARVAQLPDGPDLSLATPDGPCLMVKDYPNQWRPPVWQGMALVGDAAASLDYVHGIGCGWAMQSAAWLADAIGTRVRDPAGVSQGLGHYARLHRQRLGRHRFFIHDFAQRLDFNAAERLVFAAGAHDPACAEVAMRVASRFNSPWAFLAPWQLARAVWAVARAPQGQPGDTRLPLVGAMPWSASVTTPPAGDRAA